MRKTFAKVLSLTVTMLLISGTIMMPVSAAVPETGFTSTSRNKVTNTIYRASDAADAVDAEGNSAAWISNDDSVWKFAVGGLGDTFKASNADFAAPIAEAEENGKIKLSWTAPEGAEGKATVKVIGTNYNKEVVVTGDTVTLGDTKLNNTYSVQVTIGDVSSQILNYNNIYSPIKSDVLGSDNESLLIERNSNQQWAWTRFYVNNLTDYVGDNAGIIFKVDSDFIEENIFNVTHFENKNTSAYESLPYSNAEGEVIKDVIPSTQVGIAMDMYIGGQNAVDNLSSDKQFTSDSTATRGTLRIDTTGKESREIATNTMISGSANMKDNFYEGYFIVPFDIIGDEGIEFIKNNGVLSLTTNRYRYFTTNTLNQNGKWSSNNAIKYEYTDIEFADEESELTGEIKRIFDRELYIREAGFISDIDAFKKTLTDTANTGLVDYEILGMPADTLGEVYLDTYTPNEATTKIATDGTLSNAAIASTYGVSISSITYNTAAGEKMMLGFTAPVANKYEISCPIEADAANGIYTRVIKEAVDGTKTVIKAESQYDGDSHLVLVTDDLAQGDTVWFEAWSNSDGATIDIGIPQLVTDSSGKYSFYNYTKDLITAEESGTNRFYLKETGGALEVGYFLNPFRLDTVTDEQGSTTTQTVEGETYDMAVQSAVTAEGAVLVHDRLGIANLNVEDDATELYNRLTPYEFGRSGIKEGILASDPSCRRKNGLDGAANAYNKYTGTACLVSDLQYFMLIGYGRAFAGNSSNEPYYFNSGAYLKFTAPADGSVSFDFALNTVEIKNVVVLHNTTVKAVGTNVYTVGATSVDVKKGDEVMLCLSSEDFTAVDLREPRAVFTAAESTEKTVTFDEELDSLFATKYAEGDVITLPAVAKNGAIFQGWRDAESNLYAAGTEYTVNADVAFAADYIYYGDLNGSGEGVDGTDLSILRKMLVKVAEIEGAVNADLTGDIDADGAIDLIDLIKMKKMSAGMDVTVGAK